MTKPKEDNNKSKQVMISVPKETYDILEAQAKQEFRSVSNFMLVMIMNAFKAQTAHSHSDLQADLGLEATQA